MHIHEELNLETVTSHLTDKALINHVTPERVAMFHELVGGLSIDARTICEMILTSPNRFAGIAPKLARGKIIRILRRRKHWNWPRIWASFDEIKYSLNENP